MIFIETPRLYLRKVEEADYPYFREYLTDKEADRLMLRSPCNTEEDIRLGFEWFLRKEPRAYVIVYRQTGDVIGNLTVYDRVPENVAAQMPGKVGKALSFALSPAWRRRGLMSEAVSTVAAHLFSEEGADYISCGYLSYNLPSAKLQQKLGFTRLLTEHFPFENQEIEAIENILTK